MAKYCAYQIYKIVGIYVLKWGNGLLKREDNNILNRVFNKKIIKGE